jgi:hypothetical protein
MPFEIITAEDCVSAFMRKHQIGCEKPDEAVTTAMLGRFPISHQLSGKLRAEGFLVGKVGGRLVIGDGINDLASFSPEPQPELLVHPEATVDHTTRSVVCQLVVRTNNEETIWNTGTYKRLCWAIFSTHPDCHPIINATGMSKVTSTSLNDLGFGELYKLSDVFDEFVRRHQTRFASNGIDRKIFDPEPSQFEYVKRGTIRTITHIWRRQLHSPLRLLVRN